MISVKAIKEEFCRDQLGWVRRRLEALGTMDAKLKEMRQLAACAASRTLGEKELTQVQERVAGLQAEVNAIDMASRYNPVIH